MKRFNKIILLILFSFSFLIVLSSCKAREDINIIFTTDIHCGVDDNIGYSSLSAFKNDLEKQNKYVTLVDCGDAIQGGYVGALTKGKYIIDLMNGIGYDLMVLGNHEFDYGMDILKDRINEFNGDVLSCNISYIGKYENKLSEVKSYKIINYGSTKVAYIGITTPRSLVDSSPVNFMEDNEYAYSLCENDAQEFYKTIQDNIDASKKEGADYVILLSHLGFGSEYGEFGSTEVLKNLSGVDALIDGHAHKDIECSYYYDKDEKLVPLCSAGYKLNEFGYLTIKPTGTIQVGLIVKYDNKDIEIDSLIEDLNKEIEEYSSKVIAYSNQSLSIYDEDGIRMARNRETAIGDMVADSYRTLANSDITFVNGGSIRDNLKDGDLTFADIMKLNPFGNKICKIKATGAQILDYLEFASRSCQKEYKENGKAIGENGGFAIPSGLKYTIDTSIESTVVLDEKGSFKEVSGARRVKDVYVLINGEYIEIDPEKIYTVSGSDFVLLYGGDGVSMFSNCEVIEREVIIDYEAIVNYIVDYLKGDLKTKYSSPDGRITIE